jgi:hypothetical protein
MECVMPGASPLLPATWFSAALLAASVAHAQSITFTRIADQTTPSTDGSDIRGFNTPQLGGSTVVFGAHSENGLFSLFAAPASGGALVKLADQNTPVPGGTGNFTTSDYGFVQPFQREGCNVPVVGSTHAAFVGNDAANQIGVYSVPLKGGKTVVLVNDSTPIPGAPVPPQGVTYFNSEYVPCNVSILGNTVTFDIGGGDGEGVYSVATNGRSLARIADNNTAQPAVGPFPTAGNFFEPTMAGKTIVYIGATTGGPYGIYTGGNTTPIAPVITDGDSEASEFDQFANPSVAHGTILFAADYNLSENANVLATVPLAGAAPKIIFNLQSTKIPAGALGDSFSQLGTDANNYLGNDGKRQIFSAATQDLPPKPANTYDGVFSVCHGKLTKIMQTGDTVGTAQLRAINGISNLQLVTIGGTKVDQFAALITLGAATIPPTVDDGSPGIYVITIPDC